MNAAWSLLDHGLRDLSNTNNFATPLWECTYLTKKKDKTNARSGGDYINASSLTNMKYKGFTITEIYQSADGRGNHDYSIVPAIRKDAKFPNAGEIRNKTTVEKIKSLIDKI